MALLRLVRHGQTSWNEQGIIQGHIDVPLDETGRNQAFIAARDLRGIEYAAVVSSPLARALETADIIARSLGIVRVETNLPSSSRRWAPQTVDFGPSWTGSARAARSSEPRLT